MGCRMPFQDPNFEFGSNYKKLTETFSITVFVKSIVT